MDDAEWYCQVDMDGLPCMTVVKQPDMERHLNGHRIWPSTPDEVRSRYTLARGSHHGKPPRLSKTDDETLPMFDRKDFR